MSGMGNIFSATMANAGNPATIAQRGAIAQGANAAGTGIGVVGSIYSGMQTAAYYRDTGLATQQYYDYKADVTLNQALLAEDIIRDKGAKELGTYVSNVGKRGVQMTGSILNSYLDRGSEIERQALMQRIEGQQAATALRYQGAIEKFSNDRKADMAVPQGFINASGSLLTGVTNGLSMAGKFAI